MLKMESCLDVIDVSLGYPAKFMLKDISFSVKKGSFSGIIGPNGSGKTTLFKGISGDLKVMSGKITLNGKDMAKKSFRQKATQLAVVTQYIEQVDITVRDYVLLGRMPYKKRFEFFETMEDYEVANKYMELTGISHLKDKLMTRISGGEQQLVAIARALTQEPTLLLLDEPTSHLDITHQIQTLNLIQKLNCEMNLSVLMIIHDLNMASEYCDYLFLMNHGTLFTKGMPEEVLTYQVIEEVYRTPVITRTNPMSGKPFVFPVSGKLLGKNSSKS